MNYSANSEMTHAQQLPQLPRLLFVLRAGTKAGADAGNVLYRAWVNCDDTGVPFKCSDETCHSPVFHDCFYCDAHLTEHVGVVIRESNIPGCGLGLFASRSFSRGERIASYGGEVISSQELATRYSKMIDAETGEYLVVTAPYALGIHGSDNTRDGARIRGAGSYVNATLGTGRRPNSPLGNRYVRASRKINAGEEILCSYGAEYWKCASPAFMTHTTTTIVSSTSAPPLLPFKRRRVDDDA